jgi:DNA-binding transcriptional LysR family regulator
VLELKDLSCFVSVYETGSFSRAAGALRTAQSQVSERIQKVERLIGAPLLQRLHRRVVPTKKGELFYQHAKRVLRGVAELEAAVRLDDAA